MHLMLHFIIVVCQVFCDRLKTIINQHLFALFSQKRDNWKSIICSNLVIKKCHYDRNTSCTFVNLVLVCSLTLKRLGEAFKSKIVIPPKISPLTYP